MNSQTSGPHRLSEFVRVHYGRSPMAQTALLALPHIASLEGALLQGRIESEGKLVRLLECSFRPFQKNTLNSLLQELPETVIIPTKFFFSPDFLREKITDIRAISPRSRILLEGQAPLSFPALKDFVDGLARVDRLSQHKVWPKSRTADEYFPITAQRGCDFICSYCGHRSLEPDVQRRSPESVKDEMVQNWNSLGIHKYWFQDPIISGNSQLLTMMSALPFPIEWIGNARIEHLDPDRVSLLRKSGCIGLFLGIESGDPKKLKAFGRPSDLASISHAIDLLRENDILASASWLVDERDEKSESIRRTVEFACSIRCDLNVVNTFSAEASTATEFVLQEFGSAGLQLGVIYDVAWGSSIGLNARQALEFFCSPTENSCRLVFEKARKHLVYNSAQ